MITLYPDMIDDDLLSFFAFLEDAMWDLKWFPND